jgi:nondiscriminating aspartyl-tRNA synthetase
MQNRRTLIHELSAHAGEVVHLKGWLNNLRALGNLSFLILRDRTGFVQVVIEDKEESARLSHLHSGSILSLSGLVTPSPQKGREVEITQPKITVVVPIEEPPLVEYYRPVVPGDLEHLLDHRPLTLRNRAIQAVFKIQAEIAHAYRLYMHDEVRAVEYFAPNLIGTSSEGGAEFFNVDYFGHTATLAQSSQLYKQIMVGVNERVFAIMPFFRAEPSHTTRHLTEGKQLEFEIGFFDHWHEILDIQENCIKFIITYITLHCQAELTLLGNPLIKCPQAVPIPRLTFQEAQELFFQRTGVDEREEDDLSPRAERELCGWALATHGIDLVFVIDWKKAKRPFYAQPQNQNLSLTNTFDLLCAGVEITSGGERRHTYPSMLEGLEMKGMDPAAFADYLSIFRYGMPPHGGFGMGLERLTMTLLRLRNIREASAFPSDTKRIAGKHVIKENLE